MPVRVGCSGWNYRDWRERVYPPRMPARRWLEHYATLFDTVEVNSTFYRLARPAAVANWLEQRPGFVFAVKAKPLPDAHEAPQGARAGRAALLRGDRAAGGLAEAGARCSSCCAGTVSHS